MSDAPPKAPDPGLCEQCLYARRVPSAKGSVFWLCGHPELPKYPPLPVRHCRGFRPTTDGEGGAD